MIRSAFHSAICYAMPRRAVTLMRYAFEELRCAHESLRTRYYASHASIFTRQRVTSSVTLDVASDFQHDVAVSAPYRLLCRCARRKRVMRACDARGVHALHVVWHCVCAAYHSTACGRYDSAYGYCVSMRARVAEHTPPRLRGVACVLRSCAVFINTVSAATTPPPRALYRSSSYARHGRRSPCIATLIAADACFHLIFVQEAKAWRVCHSLKVDDFDAPLRTRRFMLALMQVCRLRVISFFAFCRAPATSAMRRRLCRRDFCAMRRAFRVCARCHFDAQRWREPRRVAPPTRARACRANAALPRRRPR